MRGIDVSTFQGNIDWQKVKQSGVEFAIIKATQGRSVTSSAHLFTDSKFVKNISGATAAGIPCGVYHYLTAASIAEAKQEADYFLSRIAPYKQKITLWAAVDVEEDRYLPRDKTALTAVVNAFCERVQAAGYRPMVYTNPNYLRYRLNGIGQWELWLALWRSKSKVPTAKEYPNMKIWQYGGETVSGVSGQVDSNLGFFELPEPDYASLVCARCGLEPQTRAYLDGYTWARDLWRKLWDAMS